MISFNILMPFWLLNNLKFMSWWSITKTLLWKVPLSSTSELSHLQDPSQQIWPYLHQPRHRYAHRPGAADVDHWQFHLGVPQPHSLLPPAHPQMLRRRMPHSWSCLLRQKITLHGYCTIPRSHSKWSFSRRY